MTKNICMVSVHGDPLGILGTPDTGGQCLYIKEIARELIIQGANQVDTYTRYWGEKPLLEHIDGFKNCRVIRIPTTSSEFIPKEQLRPYLPEFYDNMKEYVSKKKINYNICHSHYWDGGLVGTWMAKEFNIPLVHTSHSLGVIKKFTTSEATSFSYNQRIEDEKQIYSQASAIIAESGQEKQDLMEYYQAREEKIHVIFAGVDLEWFYPRGSRFEAKKQLGFKDQILILSLGRLDPRKGFDLFIQGIPFLIEVLKPLNKKMIVVISAGNKNENGNLILNDSEKKEYDKLIKLCSDLKITQIVDIIPRLDFNKVPLWYTAADVFIVPSRYETFGLVIVEAMSCGTPVIATNIGGPPDIITNGKDGYVENPNDVEKFALRISDVLKDSKTHQEMSETAKMTAKQKFSWKRIAHQINKLYSQVLER